MAQRKEYPVWTNVEKTTFEALQRFLTDTSTSMSEFVRNTIISKLLDEGYIQTDQLEEIVVGR